MNCEEIYEAAMAPVDNKVVSSGNVQMDNSKDYRVLKYSVIRVTDLNLWELWRLGHGCPCIAPWAMKQLSAKEE